MIPFSIDYEDEILAEKMRLHAAFDSDGMVFHKLQKLSFLFIHRSYRSISTTISFFLSQSTQVL